MIVLFTSNIAGGVLQLVVQVLSELRKLNYEVYAFIPDGANVYIDSTLEKCVVYYTKVKTINYRNRRIISVSKKIMDFNPDLVWFFDNAIATTEVGLNLSGKVRQMMIMHDAGGSHPSNNTSINVRIHRFIEKNYSNKFESELDKIMLLSEKSAKKYCSLYPDRKDKTVLMNLGAHAPNVEPEELQELIGINYLLFFGRIDKYKGIERMLKAYKKYKGCSELVIAGKGLLTEKELFLINADSRIHLINRYIRDGEMIWLFQNSNGVILPYMEATQSGIIPIAYKYSKPVIVSDVEGLTQFVENERTGYICHSDQEFANAFQRLDASDNREFLGYNAYQYYTEFFNWKKNLSYMLNELETRG